jgi:hypothetical protein
MSENQGSCLGHSLSALAANRSEAYMFLRPQIEDHYEVAYLDAADIVVRKALDDADSPLMKIDPATLLAIIQALRVIIPILRDRCGYSARDAHKYVGFWNIFDRWRLNAMFRKEMGFATWRDLGGRRLPIHVKAIAVEGGEPLMATMWAAPPSGTFFFTNRILPADAK